MNPISKIHFTFAAKGINAALLSDYSVEAQRKLCAHFELPPDAVRIAHKSRLPEDAPFALSCYGQSGKPDYPAMAVAARLVLPGLQNLAKTSENYYWQVSLWNPGESLDGDLEAAGLIAKGYHRGQDGNGYLERRQREWLERTAQRCNALVNSVDNFSNEELAHIVHAELSAKVEALAAEALIARHITVGQLPFVIKQVANTDGTLEVTGSLLLNTHKPANGALGQYGGKVA